jgi:hypothetical protein
VEARITLRDILIGLGVSAVTFLATQSWNVGQTIYREWKLRRALRREIEETSPWLLRNISTLECMIQLACVQSVANNGPVPVPIQVHAEHYPDIVLKLSREEKALVNGLYNIFYNLNKSVGTIAELNPQSLNDADKMQQLRLVLDTTYRNSRRALVLIDLYVKNIKNMRALEAELTANDPIHGIEAENDQTLLKLAAEARTIGEEGIRNKYHDGAFSPLDVAPTPPPVPGKFYFDSTGAKFKCLSVEGGLVEMVQLETQVGVLTYDLYLKQPISAFRHLYELKDSEETARLERRFLALKPRPGFSPR